MIVCVCVCLSVALDIQHVMLMLRILLSSVACLVPPYFSTLFHKHHDFWEKNVIDCKIFEFICIVCQKHFLL